MIDDVEAKTAKRMLFTEDEISHYGLQAASRELYRAGNSDDDE
jgi:hypothetical protein